VVKVEEDFVLLVKLLLHSSPLDVGETAQKAGKVALKNKL